MTPTKELFTVRPSPETLMQMLAAKREPSACISDIPPASPISIEPVPHHHHACRGCHITLACFESDCTKTGDTCHDCATSCERPTWSPKEALRRHEAKKAEESRLRLIGLLMERLPLLSNEALCRVASFINEVTE